MSWDESVHLQLALRRVIFKDPRRAISRESIEDGKVPAIVQAALVLHVLDGTLSHGHQVTFSGADAAARSAKITTSGPAQNLAWNASSHSNASTISSGRVGSQNTTNTNRAVPWTCSNYIHPSTGGADIASYAQAPLDLPSNLVWGGEFGFDDAGDGGGMSGFAFSPVPAVSDSGSYVYDSTESPAMSGKSEDNFQGTAGPVSYTLEPVSSAPVSPVSSWDRRDSKRVKMLDAVDETDTGAAAGADVKADSTPTSASSSGRGGAKGEDKRGLRSASRTYKDKQERVSMTAEELRKHNRVEKHYRDRLNARFEDLLHALPESPLSTGPSSQSDDGDGRAKIGEKKRICKPEVLDLARQRILFLEEENKRIERENTNLRREQANLSWRSKG
ncbi:hypothetical protein QBC46DRAFT_356773 [Diplogelasinospora grovesii]|uniref:BHLH domain-containing protein n=1 Tax=Diplogelasinospora grovesii TaxID=303347 RepID=A0AAN6N163_9PEZI|nr:hypothetical protein QBC46DRAFT_356773 [Diplogelasinospora grovesii]